MRQERRLARTDSKRCSCKERPVVVIIALAMAGALAAVGLAPSALAKAAGKPNLVIADANASGSKYTFFSLEAPLSFKDVTKNKGDATARHSQTAMFAVALHSLHPNAFKVEVASRSVPHLRPGHSDRGGATTETIDIDNFNIGAYKLVICADVRKVVKESNEHNCRSTGRKFYVIPEEWHGSLNGSGGAGGVAKLETWHSLDVAHLVFDKYLGNGVFRYEFNGRVEWIDAGIGFCTWDGGGSMPIDGTTSGDGIDLNYAGGSYKGTVKLNDETFYPIFLSGGGGLPCTGTADGPVYPDFLTIPRRRLDFGQYNLEGKFAEPGPESPEWRWDFTVLE